MRKNRRNITTTILRLEQTTESYIQQHNNVDEIRLFSVYTIMQAIFIYLVKLS